MLVLMGFSAVVLLFPPPPSLRHRAQCSHLLHPPQANCPAQLPQDLTSSGLAFVLYAVTPSSQVSRLFSPQHLQASSLKSPTVKLFSFCTRKAVKKSRHLSNEETFKSFKPSSLKLLNLKSSSLPQAPAHFKTPLLDNNAPPFRAVFIGALLPAYANNGRWGVQRCAVFVSGFTFFQSSHLIPSCRMPFPLEYILFLRAPSSIRHAEAHVSTEESAVTPYSHRCAFASRTLSHTLPIYEVLMLSSAVASASFIAYDG
ncbi:hypothetical protein C8J57DRAFT_1725358 [Mycena rebaudengoi]|nr:hypothetical protein C8J57DRAFT_1725358 [Mycena rebaudengoi]